MDDLDTQPTPDDGQVAPGQAETPAAEATPASPVPDVESRLSQIERDYKELQKDYTRKAQQLAELRRQAQAPQSTPSQPVSEEFDWSNPGRSIRQAFRGELTEFQRQLQAEKMADQWKRDTAEQYGIPVRELDRYLQKLQESTTDPEGLAETVARMYRADHTDQAINEARRVTQESVTRNARGVTSQGGATQSLPSAKDPKDMNDKELDEYVMRTYGKADWPS